ncbi:hypothetical protein HDU99_010510, partial [Rhizoclosmatium hyalinum]
MSVQDIKRSVPPTLLTDKPRSPSLRWQYLGLLTQEICGHCEAAESLRMRIS